MAGELALLERTADETADEFLRRRLSFIQTRFSYEKLSGTSIEELNNQIDLYNKILCDTTRQFMNSDFVYADEPELYEAITGEDLDLYASLTLDQKMQIESVATEVHLNFDKAREDARDRRYDRLSRAMNAIPVINRLQSRA